MIDWARVSELKNEIGAEDFADIVDIFLEEVEVELGALRGIVPDADLESKLHFLKGSALNLGFHEFSLLCQDGETAAARGDFENINLSATLDAYDRSKMEFLAGLKETARPI